MSNHTPGPWIYQENSDAYTHIVRGPGNMFICSTGQDSSGKSEANAHLIAAAPDMLAALKAYVDDWDGWIESGRETQETVAAAILKATGEIYVGKHDAER